MIITIFHLYKYFDIIVSIQIFILSYLLLYKNKFPLS